MGECELCGAVKVGVKRVRTGKTEVAACTRCIDKMNLAPKTGGSRDSTSPVVRICCVSQEKKERHHGEGPPKNWRTTFQANSPSPSGSKLSQQQLAKKMAETVNIIKSAESGKRPTDNVIRKFERVLSIDLMVERSANENRHINAGPSRGMTFGDYLNDLR